MTITFHRDGTVPLREPQMHFVFGSNAAGRHGKGSARIANTMFGAKYGVGSGFTGNSYAIPTKDKNLRVIPLDHIRNSIDEFLITARRFDRYKFFVTRIGCGLAGYRDDQIAPLFANAPLNCSFAEGWRPFLEAQPTFEIKF